MVEDSPRGWIWCFSASKTFLASSSICRESPPISSLAPDYYTVLQVHPDADYEVIEAAYRQLMKKHHPDMAGEDPRRIAEHEARAKAINEAFSVLRDAERRRRYDIDRLISGTVQPAASRPATPHPPPRPEPQPTPQPSPNADEVEVEVQYEPPRQSWLVAPFSLLSAAYYLLPGPYEWEAGRNRELASVLLVPPLGIAAFALATGRLASLVGHSLTTNLVAWAILGLCAMVLMRGSFLRVLAASVPTAALLSGLLNPYLQQSHVPAWIAWCLLSVLSLIFAARLYVFGVVPTLGLIWFLTRPG